MFGCSNPASHQVPGPQPQRTVVTHESVRNHTTTWKFINLHCSSPPKLCFTNCPLSLPIIHQYEPVSIDHHWVLPIHSITFSTPNHCLEILSVYLRTPQVQRACPMTKPLGANLGVPSFTTNHHLGLLTMNKTSFIINHLYRVPSLITQPTSTIILKPSFFGDCRSLIIHLMVRLPARVVAPLPPLS